MRCMWQKFDPSHGMRLIPRPPRAQARGPVRGMAAPGSNSGLVFCAKARGGTLRVARLKPGTYQGGDLAGVTGLQGVSAPGLRATIACAGAQWLRFRGLHGAETARHLIRDIPHRVERTLRARELEHPYAAAVPQIISGIGDLLIALRRVEGEPDSGKSPAAEIFIRPGYVARPVCPLVLFIVAHEVAQVSAAQASARYLEQAHAPVPVYELGLLPADGIAVGYGLPVAVKRDLEFSIGVGELFAGLSEGCPRLDRAQEERNEK